MIFRLVGENTGNTAMSEQFIRIRGFDLKEGNWKIRVSEAGPLAGVLLVWLLLESAGRLPGVLLCADAARASSRT